MILNSNVNNAARQCGFTLIEVMIALTLVAVALPALIYRIQSSLDHTAHIEQKTYAYWIAENKMQELLINKQLQRVTPKAKQNDKLTYGGQQWDWEIDVEETPLEGMYRFEIRVGQGEDNWLASLSAYIRDE